MAVEVVLDNQLSDPILSKLIILIIFNLKKNLCNLTPNPHPINLPLPKCLLSFCIHLLPLPLLPPFKPHLVTDGEKLSDLVKKEQPGEHEM